MNHLDLDCTQPDAVRKAMDVVSLPCHRGRFPEKREPEVAPTLIGKSGYHLA
jgi:hypothetical protein